MRKTVMSAAVCTAAALVLVPGSPAAAAADASVTVDFTHVVTTVDSADYGLDITGYGNQSYITNNDVHRGHVRRQGFGVMRMELVFDASGKLVCGGDWCDTNVSGDAWVASIRDLGATPMLILPADGRRAASADVADAVAIYRHFKATGTPVRQFIVGNELDNGQNPKHMTGAEYSSRFNLIADALRAEDPTVRLGGPATAYYDTAYIDAFLTGSGSRADFVDYHDYGAGEDRPTDADLLGPVIDSYATDIADLRARIARLAPGRALDVQIGEWNMDWKDPNGTQMMSHLATVWGASALGTMLKSGASTLVYGDKNGSFAKNTGLGITSTEGEGNVPTNAPTPVYHGIGMFTGEGLFRGFGKSIVDTGTSTPGIRAFASTGRKNIVLVNTTTTAQTTGLALTGYGTGTAAVWQSTGDTQATWTPHNTGTLAITIGAATVNLPARSVTTLVLDDQGLKGEYFTNKALTGTPTLTRVDPGVNFDWGTAAPGPGIGADTFSTRWTGTVTTPTAAAYTFITTTDDGVRLWIDGTKVIDAWTDHSKRDDTATVDLTAGPHTIRMEYYEGGWDAIAQLHWSAPNLARQPIPASALTPAP
ncbi:hypothetical protein Afil01_52990 [Actinorhabdospora filicis]|uniref:PA14 domain-containing protein n=1 Tax=Actinorhabdospora filicis TaxID=1785913 RepID=A0A9W6SRF5_9ACTN|nr:PA14 domain-containing protein [Actinorhabdospora filicis]GLZ80492.1 hypothetical protein Afil01_52990 [Actinorhabdospora filicis]